MKSETFLIICYAIYLAILAAIVFYLPMWHLYRLHYFRLRLYVKTTFALWVNRAHNYLAQKLTGGTDHSVFPLTLLLEDDYHTEIPNHLIPLFSFGAYTQVEEAGSIKPRIGIRATVLLSKQVYAEWFVNQPPTLITPLSPRIHNASWYLIEPSSLGSLVEKLSLPVVTTVTTVPAFSKN